MLPICEPYGIIPVHNLFQSTSGTTHSVVYTFPSPLKLSPVVVKCESYLGKFMNQKAKMLTRIFSIALSLVFGISSIAKFSGMELLHQPFREMCLSTWYVYFIAVLEMTMAIGILIKNVASMSAVGMNVIFAGMSFYFYYYQTPLYLIPTGILALMAITVAYFTHDDCVTVQGMPEKQ